MSSEKCKTTKGINQTLQILQNISYSDAKRKQKSS